ncbi:MAG: DUF3307 domain-containing protein [Kiritimatiellia bacterium]
MKIFAILVCAHVLGDFLLQPNSMVKQKNKPWIFLLHLLIHGLLGWLFLAQWRLWVIPLYIIATHGILDLIKRRMPDTAKTFVVDQCLHIILVYVLAVYLNRCNISIITASVYKPLVWFSGFVATVQGSGYLVAKVAKNLIERNKLEIDGLEGGGALIGQLERALIFLFVIIGQPEGIGFLIAAKSILRFEKAHDGSPSEAKHAEYVLIGTLFSFTLAIALAYLTSKAVNL